MLTQQELIEQLATLGEKVTTQTLRNREKQSLITPAYKSGGGRPGRSVFYPDRCLWENYVASRMLSSKRLRLTADEVRDARDLALRMEDDIETVVNEIDALPESERLTLRLAEYWHAWFLYVWLGCPPDWSAKVSFLKFVEVDREIGGYDETFYSYYVTPPFPSNIISAKGQTINVKSGRYEVLDEDKGEIWINLKEPNIVKLDI